MSRENQFSLLESAILATICYFDIFDYPLSLMDIWRYLYCSDTKLGSKQFTLSKRGLTRINTRINADRFNLSKIQEALDSPKLSKVVSEKDGFYFLKGREDLIKKRQERYKIAQKKWKIAKKAAKFLQFIPFIKMVAVCNTLAYNNAKKESDIDFLIVTKHGRIWAVRFFAVLAIFLLGLRPSPKKFENKICLSFYITDRFLNFKSITLKPYDISLAYWISQLVPLMDRKGTYNRLIKSNSWIRNYLFHSVGYNSLRKIREKEFSLTIRKFQEKILGIRIANLVERGFKKIQLIFMSKEKKNLALKPDKNVIISDGILKFHLIDKREEQRKRFEEKFTQIQSM